MTTKIGHFECECGKVFERPQAFCGHQSHCEIHLGKERYAEAKARDNNAVRLAREKKSKLNKIKKESDLKQWMDAEHVCEHCGKVMTKKFGSGRFCSRACANAREKTEAIKLKTATTLLGYNIDFDVYCDGTKEKYLSGKIPRKLLKYYAKNKVVDVDYVVCPYCGLRMAEIQTGHLKTHGKTKKQLIKEYGQTYLTQSVKSSEKTSISISEAQKKLVAENKHVGWTSRKKRSYPELFWEKILVNNGIKFDFEHIVHKKDLGLNDASNYFLDFLIDGFIDLEIDGKQHQYEDRKASDKKRDALLKQHGFVIYRIPWINPAHNPEGVQKQIDDFLTWYKDTKEDEVFKNVS